MSKIVNIEVLLKAAEYIEQQQQQLNTHQNEILSSFYYYAPSSLSLASTASPSNNHSENSQINATTTTTMKNLKNSQCPLNDYINDLSRNKLFESEYKEIPVGVNTNSQVNCTNLVKDSNECNMKSRVKTHLPKKVNLSSHQISAILNKSNCLSTKYQQQKQPRNNLTDANNNNNSNNKQLTVNSTLNLNQNFELTKLALPNITSTFFEIIDKQKRSLIPANNDEEANNSAPTLSITAKLKNNDDPKRDKSIHNKLEKNRRAHLKECFETLQNELPLYKEKKVTNLLILKHTLKCVEQSKRKEREYEGEIKRLMSYKYLLMETLNKLRKELAQENFDYEAWLKLNPVVAEQMDCQSSENGSVNSDGHCSSSNNNSQTSEDMYQSEENGEKIEFDEYLSTSTASEIDDNSEESSSH